MTRPLLALFALASALVALATGLYMVGHRRREVVAPLYDEPDGVQPWDVPLALRDLHASVTYTPRVTWASPQGIGYILAVRCTCASRADALR